MQKVQNNGRLIKLLKHSFLERNFIMGYTSAFLYSIFTAISFTFIDKLDDFINPYYSLFIMSIIATLFFNIVNIKDLKKVYQHCYDNKLLYFAMTISIGINWVCSIFAPNIGDPFIYLSLHFICLAGCGLIFIKKESFKHKILDYICVVIYLILIYFTFKRYQIGTHRSLFVGEALGIIGGISGYLYAFFSNKLAKVNNANLAPTQILAVRLLPLILVLLGVIMHNKVSLYLNTKDIIIEMIMAIFTLIIPMYFSQLAIKLLKVNKFSIIVSSAPLFTFIVFSLSKMSLNKSNMILAIVITAVLMLSKINFSRKK